MRVGPLALRASQVGPWSPAPGLTLLMTASSLSPPSLFPHEGTLGHSHTATV